MLPFKQCLLSQVFKCSINILKAKAVFPFNENCSNCSISVVIRKVFDTHVGVSKINEVCKFQIMSFDKPVIRCLTTEHVIHL